MTTDDEITELLAAGDEALAEAGFRTGDFAAPREIMERAGSAAERAGDEDSHARAISGLAMVLHHENITKLMSGAEPDRSDVDAEERLFRRALSHWQETSDYAGTAQALFGLGLVYQVLHRDWTTAMPYFWQALDLATKPELAEEKYLRSEVHRHVGFYFLVEDPQPAEAVRHLQLSLDLREELGDPRRIPSGLVALAQAELAADNRQRARELLERAVSDARAAGLMPSRIEDAERQLLQATAESADGPAGADSGAPKPPV